MDEVIVRVLRTVACHARLHILSRISANETTPTALAHGLGLSLDLVCSHLAQLTSAGIVRRRRSGVRCFCAAGTHYNERALSGQISRWLQEALRGTAPRPNAPGRSTRRRSETADTSPDAYDIAFDAATAFTNVRRLQIMRRLATGGAADIATLTRELKMSPQAAGRHLDKLIRRGFVRSPVHKGRLSYQPMRGAKTPVHERLLAIVSAHWDTQGHLS